MIPDHTAGVENLVVAEIRQIETLITTFVEKETPQGFIKVFLLHS